MTGKEELSACFEQVKHGEMEISTLEALDVTVLMKLSNRLKKWKKTQPEGELRIAVLGSYSIQHFVGILDVFLTGLGIDACIYEGEYDGIQMDVLDQSSAFYEFRPQLVLLLMHAPDIKVFPALFDTTEEIKHLLDKQMQYFDTLIQRISRIEGAQILMTNLVIPFHRQLGNLEADYAFTKTEYLKCINHELVLQRKNNVTIMDMEYLSSLIGKEQWFDFSSYFLTKTGYDVNCLGRSVAMFARTIQSMQGKVKKCLVLDLDNTLWGGVVGDDGYEGIQLDPHHAVGEAYRYFQKYILELKNRGVILAICSKNEEDTAKLPFEKNENMILKLSDISCFVANWNDKAQNILQIAKELNIGTDSLVFVDDNPAEREIVKQYLKEVMVIDLPEDPAAYVTALELANPFEWTQITREDIKRSDSYVQNLKRQELEESFVNYEEYLKALHMETKIGAPTEQKLERFTQLINKSNQFNLRTKRYTFAEILSMKEQTDYALIGVELKDKFTEYGIISCIILKKNGEECFIDTWLMSCRVLKRGIEDIAFAFVQETAKKWGCKRIIGEYIPSAKNKMVQDFYTKLGFTTIENEDNRFIYPLEGND